MKKLTILIAVFAALCGMTVAQNVPRVYDLRCELSDTHTVIDVPEPRLGWKLDYGGRNLQQTGYEILVASTPEKLAAGEGDLWSTGKVMSGQSAYIPYKGKPLKSRTKCFWKVRVFTNKGESPWSDPASWEMGLLHANDWEAKWIGYDKASSWDSITQFSRLSARYLRKEFKAEKRIRNARVYVSGLGLYELYLNGKKAMPGVLTPAPTDYRKSVFYNGYDVTSFLKAGNNAIGVILGNGRYFTMRQNYKPQKINTFGYPKLLLQIEIEYADGSIKKIVSDESWKLNVDGPIRTNNEYDGEEYDATKEFGNWTSAGFNASGWIKPMLVAAPEGKLVAQPIPPMKSVQQIKPKSVKAIKPGVYIMDMGVNFSGWVKMQVNGKRGDRVQLKFAESLRPDGSLYVANLRDAKVTDVYTLSGSGTEVWEPSFVYHGFRYVEITGYPGVPTVDDFTGEFICDDMSFGRADDMPFFRSSDSTINQIYEIAWRGIASNYKGMPIDCPQRNERQPWLGDRAAGALGESYLFENAKLYAKWLDDIAQSQTVAGAIPDVAPAYWNYYSDNITWPGTYMQVADMLLTRFGDSASVRRHYPYMKKWMNYMEGKYLKGNLMTKDKYGDWCVPPESLEIIRSQDSTRTTDGHLIASAYYYHLLGMAQKFAAIAGDHTAIGQFRSTAENIREAFNKRFFNEQQKNYANNTVTANLLPLYFGMVPEKYREDVFNSLYKKIRIDNNMHISTGVIGTQFLMRGLTMFGRSDIAFKLATNRTYPSWGYMLENGATTVWELWNGNTANPQMNSQNHVMLLGDLLTWFHENLAGIKSDDVAVGFRKIHFKPEFVDGLNGITVRVGSVYGPIMSSWKFSQGRKSLSWTINVPHNTTALVYFPASATDIKDNGMAIASNPEYRLVGEKDGCRIYEIGSGEFRFEAKLAYRSSIVKDDFIFTRAPFPESHAATLVQTPKGLLAAWFGGTKEGAKDVCIWTSRFENGNWTKPEMVADGVINDSVRYACYNPVLYLAPNNELLLFYKIGPNVAGWTGWLKRSKDFGLTWSDREALPAGFLGPIKNKPVMIDGVLYCPSSTEGNGWRTYIEITPDLGKTWKKIGPLNDPAMINAIQPSLLTYTDGRLQVLCRTKERVIGESWSTDRGKTWTPMKASALPNNNSGTDAVSLRDGRQLLVYNHVKPSPELKNGKGARTPLNVAISEDGKVWYALAVLEDSPISQYSYPSVIQTSDGLVHIVYTWRRERIKHVILDPDVKGLKPIINEQWPEFTDEHQQRRQLEGDVQTSKDEAVLNTVPNSDNQYRKPVLEVLEQIEKRFGVRLRYDRDMLAGKYLTYADWRFRPTLDATLSSVLAPLDLKATREGEKKYKIGPYEYHRWKPEEGWAELDRIASQYSDVAGWELRKDSLRRCIFDALRLSPLPPAPQSAPILTPERKFNGYTVQNFALEILPGLFVNGSIYKPSAVRGKIPVVLNPDGHWAQHRYRADCQVRCASFAKMGAIAVSYDLFGWGESLLQFQSDDHRKSLSMTIQTLGGIRILDYILSLKYADASRVGITGGSGGGSHTVLMTALDDRIRVSAPVVSLSSYFYGGCPCESGMPVHACAGGTNNVEMAAMAAPRPQLVISDGKDWTDRMPEHDFPYLKRMYGYYGHPERVENVHLPTEGHDYGISKRTPVYYFFAKHLDLNIKAITDKSGNIDESFVTFEEPAALYTFGEKGEKLPAHAIKGFGDLEKLFNSIQNK